MANKILIFLQKLASDSLIVASIILSIIFYSVGIVTKNTLLDALVTVLGAFFIGYAVNRYTDMFKNKTEIENLSEKTFEQVFNIVSQLLLKSKTNGLTNNERNVLRQLTSILVSLRKYHVFDDHIIWRDLKDMEKEPEKWQISDLGQVPVYNTSGPIEVHIDVMKIISSEYRSSTSGSQSIPNE